MSGAGESRGAKKLIFSKVPNGSCDIPFDAQLKTELTIAGYFEVLSCFGRVLSRNKYLTLFREREDRIKNGFEIKLRVELRSLQRKLRLFSPICRAYRVLFSF